MRAEGAVGSEPVRTWRSGNGLNALECHCGTVVRDRVVVAVSGCTGQEGIMSNRISNGNVIPYHLVFCSEFAALFQEFTLVFLFFTSLLLHHSMDLRLTHARHFLHVGFHLVVITLLSRWRLILGARQIIRRPGVFQASCRSIDALETSVPQDRYLLRHRTHIRIGIGVGI